MHDDVDAGSPALRVEDLRHSGEGLGPLLVVGRVHVEEHGAAPGRLDLLRDAFHVRLRRPAVEVYAEDVAARARERKRGGSPETGGGTENKGPAARRGHAPNPNLRAVRGSSRESSWRAAWDSSASPRSRGTGSR